MTHSSDTEHQAATEKMSPTDMLNELIRGGHIVPTHVETNDMAMPSAYRSVPSISTAHTIPPSMHPEAD